MYSRRIRTPYIGTGSTYYLVPGSVSWDSEDPAGDLTNSILHFGGPFPTCTYAPGPLCPRMNERRSYTNTYLNNSGSLRIRYAALRFDVPIHHHLGSLIILMDPHMHMVYVSVFVYIIPPGILPSTSASASKFYFLRRARP